MAASLAPVQDSRDLTLKQSVALLICLESCWRDDVLVLSSADKFLRLSLQLLSRLVQIGTWILHSLFCLKPFHVILTINCLLMDL